jgi:transcriptional regulator with XRE-family HTH domain
MKQGWALAGLIKLRNDEGWSYRKIAKQAGGGLTHSQVQKWAVEPKKHSPTREQLQALAEGLRMPPEIIFEAANQDWTTAPTLIKAEADDGSVLIIASQLKELSEQDRRTIQDLTDTLYRRMKEEDRRRANG